MSYITRAGNYLRKNFAPIMIGVGMGVGVDIGRAILDYKKQCSTSPNIGEFWNPISTAPISLDEIAVLFVATGTILTNPAQGENIRIAFTNNDVYGKRPLIEFTRDVSAELYARRERQFMGLVANFRELERKQSPKPGTQVVQSK